MTGQDKMSSPAPTSTMRPLALPSRPPELADRCQASGESSTCRPTPDSARFARFAHPLEHHSCSVTIAVTTAARDTPDSVPEQSLRYGPLEAGRTAFSAASAILWRIRGQVQQPGTVAPVTAGTSGLRDRPVTGAAGVRRAGSAMRDELKARRPRGACRTVELEAPAFMRLAVVDLMCHRVPGWRRAGW